MMLVSSLRPFVALLILAGAQAAPTSTFRSTAGPTTTLKPTSAPALSFPAHGCLTTSGDIRTISQWPVNKDLGPLESLAYPMPTTTIPFCLCEGQTITSLAVYVDKSGTGVTTQCAADAVATQGWDKITAGPDPKRDFPTYLQEPAANSECSNIDNVHPDCWWELELSAYAHWWWFEHGPSCGSKGFSECFLLQTVGTLSSDCNHLDAKNCLLENKDKYKGQANAVRNYYIAHNIIAMNSFFSNYYDAVDLAQGIAAGQIGDMVNVINPQHDAKEGDLKFALDILAIPMGIASLIPVEGEWLKIMEDGLKDAVDVAKELLPEDPNKSNVGEQLLDWANTAKSLSDLTGAIEVRLNNALAKAMNDVEAFIGLGNSKAFSWEMSQMADKESMKQAVLQGMMTFAASQLYQLTGHVLTRAPNTNVVDLQKGGNLNWDTGCGGGLGALGECDNFYVHTASKTTYGLVKLNDATVDFNPQMQSLFKKIDSGAYTTGELLYHGAAQCKDAGASPTVDITKPGFGASCLSSIRVCTWNMDSKASLSDVEKSLTTDCGDTRLPWMIDSLGDELDDNEGFWFPNAYLGTLIHPDRDHGSITFWGKGQAWVAPFNAGPSFDRK